MANGGIGGCVPLKNIPRYHTKNKESSCKTPFLVKYIFFDPKKYQVYTRPKQAGKSFICLLQQVKVRVNQEGFATAAAAAATTSQIFDILIDGDDDNGKRVNAFHMIGELYIV